MDTKFIILALALVLTPLLNLSLSVDSGSVIHIPNPNFQGQFIKKIRPQLSWLEC